MKSLAIVVLLAACSAPTKPAVVPQLDIVAGDAQTDTVGKVLPVQLTAALRDAQSGAPLAGRVLNWSVVSGGGTVFVAITQTGSDGRARQSWTLGTTSGNQKVVARFIDPDTGLPITLDTAFATALPGVAAGLTIAHDSTSNVAIGDTVLVRYWLTDQWQNVGALCADKGSMNRAVWSSSDSASLLPLGTSLVRGGGLYVTRMVAKAPHASGMVIVTAAMPSSCVADSVSGGLAYLIQ